MTYKVRWREDKAGCDVITPWGSVHVTWEEMGRCQREDETEVMAAERLALEKLRGESW